MSQCSPDIDSATGCGAQALRVVRQMLEAYDSGQLQMSSPEIGEPEVDIPYHPWHEEMLHYARLAVSAAPAPSSAGIESAPIDNPLKAYTVEQLQYEIAWRLADTSTERK